MRKIAMDDQNVIHLSQLTEAITRCSGAHPANNHVLHPDVSKLADLLGLMIYYKVNSMPVSEIESKILDVYQKWKTN